MRPNYKKIVYFHIIAILICIVCAFTALAEPSGNAGITEAPEILDIDSGQNDAAAEGALPDNIVPDPQIFNSGTDIGSPTPLDQDISMVSILNREAVPGEVSIDIYYGFRNTAKTGRALPFDIKLTNNTGEDINGGELVVSMPGNMDVSTQGAEPVTVRYRYDVSIASGGTEDVRTTISVPDGGDEITASLYNAAHELIGEKKTQIRLSAASGSELLIGVLSRKPDKLTYFKNISISNTGVRTRTVDLDPEDLAETVSGYDQLDMLLVSNFDTDKISEEAIVAISQWVDNGGVLCIGTGGSVKAALTLGRDIEELSVVREGMRSVNMGLKYSRTKPDDAVLELNICSVFAASGIQVMQSDDIAMLTTVQRNNGLIAIAGFDFCDISEFCTEEMQYTDDLLKATLGTTRLSRLSSKAGSSTELYENAMSMVGISDPDRLPSAGIYIAICLIYVLAIALIYVFLRNRNLSVFYHIFVVIASFMSGLCIWLTGSLTRNDGISMDCAIVRELHDGFTSDAGYIKVYSASLKNYEIGFPEGYEVHPVMWEPAAEEPGNLNLLIESMRPLRKAEGNASAVSIDVRPEGSILSIDTDKPFASIVTEYSHRNEEATSDGILADFSFFNNNVSGSLTNNSGYKIQDAAILFYGKLIYIGDIEAGERIALDAMTPINYPIGNSEATAMYITGISGTQRGELEHMRLLRRHRLLSSYMRNSMYGYFRGARFIGFTEDGGIVPNFTSRERLDLNSCMLISAYAEPHYEDGGYVWVSGLENEPKLSSGNYDAATNTMTGSCIIEYSFGTDIDIVSLGFSELSEEFYTGETERFRGQMSLYNYTGGGYDFIADPGSVLDPGTLSNYLSPGNTITVRYTADDSDLQTAMYLPIPEATGRERSDSYVEGQ